MIKTKTITLILTTAFLMMFAVAMVSAVVTFEDVVDQSQSIDPGTRAVVTFAVKEGGDGITNLAIDSPITFSGCSESFDTSLTISGLPSSLNKNQKSGIVTVSFNVPTDQLACTSYTGDLILRGKYTLNVDYTLPLTLTVKEKPSIEVTEPTTLTQSSDSTFTITNTGNTILSPNIEVDDLKYNGNELTFTVDGDGSLNPGESQEIIISSDIPNDNSLLAGQSTTIHINADGINEITKKLNVETSYCSNGEAGGNLKIDRIKFTNLGAYGDRDEWYLLGEIETEIRVKNTGDDDVDNIIVEWGLYNKDSGEFIIDNEENDFDLKDGDTETLNIKFTLDPNDFNEDFNEDDFVFLVKAYSDDRDVGEDLECNSARETIKILKDKHFVVLNDIVLKTDSLPCNELLEGQFDIWNIGANDEEDIEVVVFNEELGIDQKIIIGDLDILEDKKSVPFSLRIPQDAEEKQYEITFKVLDEDGDVFQNDADDDAEFLSPTFDVSGSCAGGTADLLISAELDPETPEAVAGKKIIVKTTLRNRGDKEETYTISVQGNSAWSTLDAIDPQVVTLAPDESDEVSIILNINSDAEGNKEFTIRATTSEGKSTEQRVQVPITTTPTVQQSDLATHLRENWFIYVIIIVNIILIIAIIMVIRRMVSPAPL